MRNIICRLKFKDGGEAVGEVSVESPQTESAVAYSGQVGRLPTIFKNSDIPALKALFTVHARELGADLQVEESGEYAAWAQ